MTFSDVQLPSNKKFGFFFSGIFGVAGAYLLMNENAPVSYAFFTLGLLFLTTTFVKANALLPLNKLWMRLGLLLGAIVSPIVLGIIFFGIFTPIGILMRLFRRDELRLKFKDRSSHWIVRESKETDTGGFKYQF